MATYERPVSGKSRKPQSLIIHQFVTIVLILGLVLNGVPVASAGEERVGHTPEGAYNPELVDGPQIMSNAYADALDLYPGAVASLSFANSDPNGYTIFNTPASGFPTKEDDYLVISSGCTSLALDPNYWPNTTCVLSGLNNSQIVNNQLHVYNDMVQMSLTLNVPPAAQSWFVDAKFFSEEFPEWVGSPFNDAFLIEEGTSNFTIGGLYGGIYAPNNWAWHQGDQPLTINSLGNVAVSPTYAYGTTYDAATRALSVSGPTNGQTTITLIFTVMDVGDSYWDTTVFLDNFRFSAGPHPIPPMDIIETCYNGIDDNGNGQIDEGCNTPPTVAAGGPYGGSEGAPISLNGSVVDSDLSDPITTSWSYTTGPDVTPGATCSFDDPDLLSPTLTCTDNGTYYATLTANDGTHAAVSAIATVNVQNVAPTASFTASSQVNEGSSISLQLSNSSDPSSTDSAAGFSYAFDCGSGYGSPSGTASTSCATDDNGTRTVKAKISDKNGGTTEYIGYATINNVAPTASFTASSPVNEGDSIQLALTNPTDPSSADRAAGFSYAFDCGSGYGSVSSAATASCATNDNGVRTVKAKISDKNGGTTEYTSTSAVRNVAPSATFTTSSQVNEGTPISLALTNPTDPSSADRAAGFGYTFDCGNGYGGASGTATANCATNDNGVRTVKAKISDKDGGATEYTATSTINNVAPTATFTASSPVNEGDPIGLQLSNVFDPSSVDTAAGFSYAFDCGSGYGSASSTATANCATNDNGTRTVKAKISDKNGGATEYVAHITINNIAPTATFTASSQVNEGESISLALSNPFDPSSADRAAGFSYAFDCGSGYGSASSTATANCVTNDDGVRTVKAKISDKNGGTTEYVAQVTINNIAPIATFTASSPVNEGDPIELKLSNPSDPSSTDRAAGLRYSFDCGNGYGSVSGTATASCATNDNGTRMVKARVSDKDGGTTDYIAQVTINNVAPTATFTALTSVNEGDPISLALSNPFDPSSVDTAAGFSYAFDCGSGYGSASSTATANCATTDNGVRTVKAKISDKNGGATEYAAQITINNVAPIATFTTVSPVNEGDLIQLSLSNPFDPSSVDTAAGFSYAFDCGSGYGSASSTATANCATTDNGVRTVKAKISDKNGGATEYTATSTINNVAPTASFTASSPVNESESISLALTNPADPSSVDTTVGFSYAFDCGSGYGSVSGTALTSCATNDNGVRTVKAKISDKDGGATEYTATSTINNVAPTASFTASSPVDESESISLDLSNAFDPSSVDTAAGFSYAFDCGSGYGSASGTATASCATNDNGLRTVKAKISDKDGGATEYSIHVTVNNIAPTASFTASSPVDESESISLDLSNAFDPSSVDTAAGFSYAFDCGSGYSTAGSTTTASCATTDDGVRTVKAKISDKDGGATEYSIHVTINNVAPTASFTTSSPVNEGDPISLDLSNPFDPSSVDTAAGFSYAFDCGSGYGSASSTATASCATNDNGLRTVKAKISDKDGGVTEYIAYVTINNVAPTASFTASSPVNEGDPISLDLSNAFDPSSVDTAAGFSYAFDCGGGYGSASSTATASCATNDNGLRTVKAKIIDKDGDSTEYIATSTVDNVAPTATFTASSPVNEGSPIILRLTNPSDPSSVDTTVGFTYTFDCGGGYGTASSTATASCATNDNGTRTVKAKISDKDGGTTEYITQATINNVAPVVGPITVPIQPIAVSRMPNVNVSAPFTDPGTADTHTAVVDWGDGLTSAATVTYNPANGTGSVQSSHAYPNPGLYTIKITVTDDDGGSGSAIYQYVVVYDPNGAFVTSSNNSIINSPAGAYVANPSLSGEARFWFKANYQKNATVPDGGTEFAMDNLNFRSTAYEWLVVMGPHALAKGSGTINGVGNYGFIVSAIDGALKGNGGAIDKFRIKIWDKNNGDAVVYDSQIGAELNADPTIIVQKGNIEIH